MLKTITYLIDPHEKKVSVHELENGKLDLAEVRKAIDCAWVDAVRIGKNLTMWVDDEGLYAPNQKFFGLEPYHYPYAGKALMVPCVVTEEGDEVILLTDDEKDAPRLANLLEKSVRWLTRDEAIQVAVEHDKWAEQGAKDKEKEGFTVITTSVADAIKSGVYTDSPD